MRKYAEYADARRSAREIRRCANRPLAVGVHNGVSVRAYVVIEAGNGRAQEKHADASRSEGEIRNTPKPR